jgi:DNA-binding NarL/FixJ family response regulator
MGAGVSATRTEVLVVDDQRSFADAIALAIDTQADLQCAGTVDTAAQALTYLESAEPAVLLVDIGLPGMDGVTLTARVKERWPAVRILILTASVEPAQMARAAKAGADGFLRKDQPLAEVLGAIRDPDAELLATPQALAALMREAARATTSSPTPLEAPNMTDRELQILSLLAQGKPVKRIARDLDISIFTCRGHVRSILEKLGAHSQLAAVVHATQLGILPAVGT